MPRIRQNAEAYAVADFQKEVRMCQGEQNLMSVRALADAIDVAHSTLYPKIKSPGKFTVAELQRIVPVLHPDIKIVLTLLGYSAGEIRKFKEE